MRKSISCFLTILLACTAMNVQAAVFAEFNPFSSSGNGPITGTLGSIPFTMSIVQDSGTDRIFDLGKSVFDNTSNNFSNEKFTTATASVDQLGFRKTDGVTNDAVWTIVADSALVDPHFHFAAMSELGFDFSLTTGFTSLDRLSGNGSKFIVDGGVVKGNPSSGSSAQGSVRLNGSFSTITIGLIDIGALGDAPLVQFSDETTLIATPVPAAFPLMLSALAGLGVMGFRKKSAKA